MNNLIKEIYTTINNTALALNIALVLSAAPSFAVDPIAVPQPLALPNQTPNGSKMAGQQQKGPQLNPEDLKMLEEAEQQINNYVSSLSPEEQKKFWSDVDELSKVMSTMSEDELLKFMDDVFNEETAAVSPKAPETPVFTPSAPEIKVEEKKPTVPADKQQAAIKLIDSVITRISNFLRKAQTMVELPGKVITWTKEGKLKNWPATLTWDVFKGHIDDLNQRLNKLKDRDPVTNKYKYIEDFIKDEALINNLTKLNDILIKHEPAIEVASFGIDRMTTTSRQAIRNVIMGLHEAHAVLGIPQAIDKIFEKYEPTAKKIKESQEAAQKQALEASKRPKTTPLASVGGTPADRRGLSAGHDYEYKPGEYYNPSFNIPEQRYEKPTEETKDKKASSAPAGGKEGGKEKGPEKPAAKREEYKAAEDAIKDLEVSLGQSLVDTIESNKNFEFMYEHMRNKNAGPDAKFISTFETVMKTINGAHSKIRAIKRMKATKLTEAQKKEYTDDVRKIIKEYKPTLDNLVSQINSIDANLNNISTLSENGRLKRYAYFGIGKDELLDEFDGDKAKTDKVEAINPINLFELRDKITELNQLVNEL